MIMKKYPICLVLLFVFLSFQPTLGKKREGKPKIVIGMMVDQMRWDYLYRFQDRYTEGGFKRLLKAGFSCENTLINYAPTITGCGHASVYTGSVPAIHGIVGNAWPLLDKGTSMNCVGDEAVSPLGTNAARGKASPRNLLTTTIGDELRMASNFRSKVVGVSIKDRGAILPAGHAANGAFWFDSSSGNFISSTWYMNELPAWVRLFNERKLPERLTENDWHTLYSQDSYQQSVTNKSIFPHLLKGSDHQPPVNVSNTPYGNTLVLEFAKAALEGYAMGQGNDTDLLAISLSSTDAVGHRYGPNSVEVEDTYLRLDKELATFFDYLDERYGKEGYLFFISADHGVSHTPEFLIENKLPGGGMDGEALIQMLNADMKSEFGIDSMILASENSQLYLNRKAIAGKGLSQPIIENRLVALMKNTTGIANAIPTRDLGIAVLPEPIKSMLINGQHAERGGDIVFMLQSGWKTGSLTGASHSHWNPYDAHIPLVWMGWGISPGRTNRTVHMTDIAPTLAAMLRIQMPSGNVGHVITEVMD